jgi:hypothetical protein
MCVAAALANALGIAAKITSPPTPLQKRGESKADSPCRRQCPNSNNLPRTKNWVASSKLWDVSFINPIANFTNWDSSFKNHLAKTKNWVARIMFWDSRFTNQVARTTNWVASIIL